MPQSAASARHERRALLDAFLADRGNPRLRELMVRENTRLVHAIRRTKFPWVHPESELEKELVQEGMIGLVQALDKFDEGRGTQFSTLATWWIRQGMARYFEKSNHLISMSAGRSHAYSALLRVEAHYEYFVGCPAENDYELGQFLDCRGELVSFVRRNCQHIDPLSLDVPCEEGGDPFSELVATDAHNDPLNQLLTEDPPVYGVDITELSRLLGSLSERERKLLADRTHLVPLQKSDDHRSREGTRQATHRLIKRMRAQLGIPTTLPVKWIQKDGRKAKKRCLETENFSLFMRCVKAKEIELGVCKPSTNPLNRTRPQQETASGKNIATAAC